MPDSSAPESPVGALAGRLVSAAARANQRRLLVLAGDSDAGWDAVFDAVAGSDVDEEAVTLVTTREGFRFECVDPTQAESLLGTTRSLVVYDAHEGFSPNRLGRLSGVVDGGGLLVVLTPSLDEWPTTATDFDERLAVPPFDAAAVGGRFRRRLVGLVHTHPGVAVVDVDDDAVERDGEMDAPETETPSSPVAPPTHRFPTTVYDACLTRDQSRAVAALERLFSPANAVVVEADRGRGKSSAAGLAAAAFAREGCDVVVTAPQYRNAREVFARAEDLCERLDIPVRSADRTLLVGDDEGGRIRYLSPPDAASAAGDADVVLVDEAAALPVRLLTHLLAAERVGFFTTVHGYEGAGRGFTVRFRDHLSKSDHTVTDVRLDDPIRYARGDPVESFVFRALLLDARPPVDQLVADATPESVTYDSPTADELVGDEHLLREAFGLLVLAHYRTEPDDLARLLDAPNLTLRTLTHQGHVVSVALMAREGGLDADTRAEMYEGGRVRGNMLPDVLTSQLRDEDAAEPVGYRVMRIATHHAVRSRGLGSHLLASIRDELSATDPLAACLDAGERTDESTGGVDWVGVGYGATPPLVSFWRENGFSTLYLSTSRNETSGEHSVVMADTLSTRGTALVSRHTDWFLEGLTGVLSDPLSTLEPDVVRAALRAVERPLRASLSDRDWRLVVDASSGPGLYSVSPRPFRLLALQVLTTPGDQGMLTPRQERLLVRKVLQAHEWDAVADELGFVSTGQCMKALGEAYRPIVERYGDDGAKCHRQRYERESEDEA